MTIYFIQVGDDGPIKVGFSESPKARIAQLQSAHPYKLQLLALQNGDLDEEKQLHQLFACDHLQGEWYRPSPALLGHVANLIANPQKIEDRPSNRKMRRLTNPHVLEIFLQERGRTLSWFAQKLGCSVSHLHDIKTGRGKPSLPLAAKIEDATGGQVTMRDLLRETV